MVRWAALYSLTCGCGCLCRGAQGKAVLFKEFAALDAFDIELNQPDADKFIEAVVRLGIVTRTGRQIDSLLCLPPPLPPGGVRAHVWWHQLGGHQVTRVLLH